MSVGRASGFLICGPHNVPVLLIDRVRYFHVAIPVVYNSELLHNFATRTRCGALVQSRSPTTDMPSNHGSDPRPTKQGQTR